jgi:YD repeat-containing protein
MKKTIVFATIGIFSASILFAADDAKVDVKAAAKKIGDKNNYSWTSTTKMEGAGGGGGGRGFGGGPTDGQFADGLIYLKSTFGDRTMHTAAKGEKVIFKGEDEWEVADDGAQGAGAFAARRMRTFKAPAAEVADLADKAQSLKSADGVISGDLTEAGAKSFLTFGGRRQNADAPGPKNAKGSVKFWVKDGELTKYEYNVQGKITGREDTEIPINRTTTVEIKDVGKTKLTLPDEAKKKF